MGHTGLTCGQYTQNALPMISDSGTSQLSPPESSQPGRDRPARSGPARPHARPSLLQGLLSPSIRYRPGPSGIFAAVSPAARARVAGRIGQQVEESLRAGQRRGFAAREGPQ